MPSYHSHLRIRSGSGLRRLMVLQLKGAGVVCLVATFALILLNDALLEATLTAFLAVVCLLVAEYVERN